MSELKMREEFEAWWMSGAYGSRKYDRFSEIGLTEDDALEIWEASRAALVIELPTMSENNRSYDQGIYDTKIAIEAAGLKVAP